MPKFSRFVYHELSNENVHVSIEYRPEGFRGDNIVSVEFDLTINTAQFPSGAIQKGQNCMTVAFNHSANGHNKDFDPISQAENFAAAYNDAVVMANFGKQLFLDGTSPIDLFIAIKAKAEQPTA